MRILTVRQPWAWAIVHGGKDVENRVRNIAGDYRGPVAIHVSKGLGSYNEREEALQEVYLHTADDVRRLIAGGPRHAGHIIGVVDLTDSHRVANPHFHPVCYDPRAADGLREAAASGAGACSKWAHPAGEWHLVLSNPRALAAPIAYRGALGLRALDAETTARVLAALA